MLKVFVLFLIAFLSQCASVPVQGIKGQVFWLSGDQMPGPDKKRSPQQGVVREIIFYEATLLAETQQQNGFFTNINKQPVATVTSAQDGSFTVTLPPGKYSVFIKEQEGLFANLYDGDGCINCVTVQQKQFTWLSITIDFAAAY